MYVWHSKLFFNKYGAEYDQIVLGTLFEVWSYPELHFYEGLLLFKFAPQRCKLPNVEILLEWNLQNNNY